MRISLFGAKQQNLSDQLKLGRETDCELHKLALLPACFESWRRLV